MSRHLFRGDAGLGSYEGGAWSDYVSGASLSQPGSYEIHFYRKDSDETSDISFTVAQPVSSSEPSRYVDNLIVPKNQIDPDLGNETGPSIGGWSYDDTGTGAGDVHPASGGYTVPLLPTADPSELANPPRAATALPSLPAWG
jgi:hypothetical protein